MNTPKFQPEWPNKGDVWKKWLSVYKTRNVYETAENKAKDTINCLYKVIHKVSIGAKIINV